MVKKEILVKRAQKASVFCGFELVFLLQSNKIAQKRQTDEGDNRIRLYNIPSFETCLLMQQRYKIS